MEYSIGVDCENINRFKKENIEKYESKFLSEKEIEYYKNFSLDNKVKFIASRFSCKEAVLKAIGIGISTISFDSITIINNEKGQPFCFVEGYECSVSISYCGDIVYTNALVKKD